MDHLFNGIQLISSLERKIIRKQVQPDLYFVKYTKYSEFQYTNTAACNTNTYSITKKISQYICISTVITAQYWPALCTTCISLDCKTKEVATSEMACQCVVVSFPPVYFITFVSAVVSSGSSFFIFNFHNTSAESDFLQVFHTLKELSQNFGNFVKLPKQRCVEKYKKNCHSIKIVL